ncbi:hypothetical protein [Stenotrophomonas sp. YIM B06876]|uniref:hypothetical protein n=1 Tax=Stenotrophomonas sp. YIM B06876 TaxID=3060211 RepID=UPI002738AE68|nr:hypothetical protein [Stenotrophomonas sp. YIM B06876]
MNSMTRALLFSLASLMFSGQAVAGSSAEPAQDVDALQVLVTLDARGKVSRIDLADRMSPALTRVLRQDIEQIVSSPAFNATGSLTGRQFVANMASTVTPLADGNYSVDFTMVSSQPLSHGTWVWQRSSADNPIRRDYLRLSNPSLQLEARLPKAPVMLDGSAP